MAFYNSHQKTTNPPENKNELSAEELEFLMHLLKNIDFKGFQVELFYNLVIKLQNQYLQKKQ